MQAWLEQHGPVQALVDGANVALYGQNWERGAFSFGQVKGVLDQLGRQHPDLRPLMVSVGQPPLHGLFLPMLAYIRPVQNILNLYKCTEQ